MAKKYLFFALLASCAILQYIYLWFFFTQKISNEILDLISISTPVFVLAHWDWRGWLRDRAIYSAISLVFAFIAALQIMALYYSGIRMDLGASGGAIAHSVIVFFVMRFVSFFATKLVDALKGRAQ